MRASSLAYLAALSLVGSWPAFATAREDPVSIADLIKQLKDANGQRDTIAKTIADLKTKIAEQLKLLNQQFADLGGPPTPGPGPVIPPTPVVPTDPLAAKVKAAFDADPGSPADKRQWAIELSGYYSAAVDAKLADDPTITTAGQLIDRIRKTTTLDRSKLTGTRTVIGQEIAAILGTAETQLDAAKRAAVASLFSRIETALDGVAK